MKKILRKIFNFFSSLKLAVILILSLAIVLATGTFYEAEYGTPEAQRVIYHSWYSSLLMLLLIINLAGAALDRLPWKKHHVGFVITHMGIITLILGSFITQQRGIDGSLALGVNETADNFVVLDEELHIYQSFDGKPFSLLHQKAVDFASHRPPNKRFVYKLVDDDVLAVIKYIGKAVRKVNMIDADSANTAASPSPNILPPKNLPAVHFTLANDRVNVSEWLGLDPAVPPFYDLGPATVSFIKGPLPVPPQPRNQIVIYQERDDAPLRYAIFSSRNIKPTSAGLLKEGEFHDTGWMNIKFSIDHFFNHAKPEISYVEADHDVTSTTSAIQLTVNDKTPLWFELDNPHEIKGTNSTYFVSYTHKKYELGFQVSLKRFKMGLYGGSNLPMTYESTVAVNNGKETVISMNEPLKFNDYTLYQSSYETNDKGEPVLSVFSINYDPGRVMKYVGALGIVGGIAFMFYWKPRYTRKPAAKPLTKEG